MKIHTQIRKEILSLLEAKLTDIEHFYNGQRISLILTNSNLPSLFILMRLTVRSLPYAMNSGQLNLTSRFI
ncbi:Uncharacterised protein [Mannheimia haemolytica]|uniref:Uncharacterized protein n=1 Tax=Mannheimia haemolytica TaxID=75985 RepID=A0A378N7H2_MANHA|nr:Uncharacterised protein [Mannheimia haemolytica]